MNYFYFAKYYLTFANFYVAKYYFAKYYFAKYYISLNIILDMEYNFFKLLWSFFFFTSQSFFFFVESKKKTGPPPNLDLISHLVNFVCELGQIMTRYVLDFLCVSNFQD